MKSPLPENVSSMNVTVSVMIDDSNVSNADQSHGTRTFCTLIFMGPLSHCPCMEASIRYLPLQKNLSI
jgi:hypothetical protein